MEILLSTTDQVVGRRVTVTLGLVKGSTIKAKWFGKDLVSGIRQVFGGELKEYNQMMAEARDEATRRMIKEAEKLGANAVVGIRYQTSMVMAGSAEILAYGTAVKISHIA